jgi:hypothetical protein
LKKERDGQGDRFPEKLGMSAIDGMGSHVERPDALDKAFLVGVGSFSAYFTDPQLVVRAQASISYTRAAEMGLCPRIL